MRMNNDLTKVCRACLTTEEIFTYVLFENVSPATYLFCTSIQVADDDNLPRSLCRTCYEMITKYSAFKKTCIDSQNTLINRVNSGDTNSHGGLLYEGVFGEEFEDVKVENTFEHDENAVEKFIQTHSEVEFSEAKFELKEEATSHNDDYYEDSSYDLNKPVVPKMLHKRVKSNKLKLNVQGKTNLKMTYKKHNFACDLCPRTFKYRKRFDDHKLEHNRGEIDKNLQCLSCSKTFQSPSGLKRHSESAHAGVRLSNVSCARCGRVCASARALRAHTAAHDVSRAPAVCHVCGKRVSSAVILRAHLETHIPDRERRHTCEHCGKKFFTNTILLSHIKRLHTGLRFICGVCEYPFTDKYNLAKHLLIHDGKKLYKCEICDKSYATNGNLVEHRRIHSGERPFLCSFCPKSFLSKRRLMDHHRIHTGDKPHKCVVCEQRFTQRGTLKRHMKVHDPTKPLAIIS